MLLKGLRAVLNWFTNTFFLFYHVEMISIVGKSSIVNLLPVIGYALLIASLGDFVYLLFPLKLQNPSWALQTLGALVEQCWGFLIALALIFSRYFHYYENQSDVRYIELLTLKLISWLVLVMAIMFILSTPIIVLDTVRLYRIIPQQIGVTDATKLAQIRQIETQVGQASDPKTLMAISQSVGLDPKRLENTPIPQFKSAVKEHLSKLRNNIETQVNLSQQEQSQKLLKSSFRTLYCGLIISFVFLVIWFKIRQVFWQ